MLKGNLELANVLLLAGWAHDDSSPGGAVELSIIVNDVEVGTVVADRYRDDLRQAGVGDGRHAFCFVFPLDIVEPSVVRIVRQSDDDELPGSPVTLNPSRSLAPVPHTLIGTVDTKSLFGIGGWVRDTLRPDEPVSLVISKNGEFLGRVLANSFRKSLKDAGIGSGRFAFEFEFPDPISSLEAAEIRVRSELSGAELSGSPVQLKPIRSFDGPLQQTLASVLDRCGAPDDLPSMIDFLVRQTDRLLQKHADVESMRSERDRYRRLRQRWNGQTATAEEAVPQQPAPPLRALVIDDRLPGLNRDAGSNAIHSHMLSLGRLGYQLTIAPADDFYPPASDRAAMEAIGVSCCCAPYYGSVEEVLRRQAGEFDLIYLHRISNAAKYGQLAASHFPKARRIYSVADLHHVRILRQAAAEDRPELVKLGQQLRFTEFAAAAFSNAVITHSNSEAELLRSQLKGASVFTIPWSVKPKPTSVPFSQRSGIAFIGSYGHPPNRDAIRWLIKDIMPAVRSRDPSIRCYLVGSDMPDELRDVVTEGITLIGHVPDLATVFDRVRLTVAPLTYGAGLKGKVMESLSAGVPCVCTEIAAEGFELPDGLREHVADDPDSIASSIVALHNDQRKNQHCSQLGLELINEQFSVSRIDALMREAAGLVGKP